MILIAWALGIAAVLSDHCWQSNDGSLASGLSAGASALLLLACIETARYDGRTEERRRSHGR